MCQPHVVEMVVYHHAQVAVDGEEQHGIQAGQHLVDNLASFLLADGVMVEVGGLLLLELLQRNKYGGRIDDELCPTVAAVQQVAVAECFAQVGSHRNAASDDVWLVNDLSSGAIFRCKRHSLLADADVQAIAKSRFHLFGFIAFGCKVNDK